MTAAARVLVAWCPDLASASDMEGCGQLAAVVEEFCPRAEVAGPGTCAIGVKGPARYFGGEKALAAAIAAALTRRGYRCRTGIADGLFAARLAARAGAVVPAGATRRFLAPYPVGVLGNAELAGLLARLGITTLGAFAALPAAAVASRFGPAGTAAQRMARGLEGRPLITGPPAAGLSVACEFDPPEQRAEPVIFTARALAERMHAGLAGRGLACLVVEIQVSCADGTQITRRWRHDGLLPALAVVQRVRWQLAGWPPARDDAAGGITALRLVPGQLVRDAGRQLALWGEEVISGRAGRAAARVQAMLGHDAVLYPVPGGGRGPADEVALVPFGEPRPARLPAGRPWPARIPPPSPAIIYPVPLPAAVTDASGNPVTVTGRANLSASPALLAAGDQVPMPVTAWAGPWPVTERWWRPARACRKARFQLVAAGSAWLASVRGGRWQVEASY